MAEFIAEPVTICIEEKTAFSSEGLSSQEFPFRARVLGVNETSRVHLNLVHIDAIAANRHDHLLSVTSSVDTVCGSQVESVWSPFLQ